MPSRKVALDLSGPRALLLEMLATVNELDGQKTEVDYDRGRTRVNNPAAAAISRDLLRLSALATAVSGEFGVEYWRFKGFQDPRDVDYGG